MILAGEIGATKTRLAAFENDGNKLTTVVEKTYMSQQENSLPNVITNFVKTEGIPVHSACFGVAGPVRGKTSKISNLAWTINADELAALLKLKSVGLINDLEAYAYGIDGLESKDFVTLSEGTEDPVGNRAVISARTGLGVAGLYWDGFRHHPFACEGGHSSFAPGNELEIELLQYLHKKHGRVSCERVLSGSGVRSIYEFLRDTKKEQEPDWLKDQLATASDAPALISQLALEKKASICEKTLEIFVGVYGSQTGDCALTFMTTGGMFIGGSIAAKILPLMKAPIFMQSFLAKGRMQGLLNDIPVKIVLNDNSGMLGAARYTLIQKAFKN
jgi:glucokinase